MPKKTFFYKDGRLVEEKIATEWLLRRFAHTRLSRFLSRICGLFMNCSVSRSMIDSFVKDYSINMEEFIIPEGGFLSFNDFFIRRLKPQARFVDYDASTIVSPADSKLLAITEIDENTRFFVKSSRFCLEKFLGDKDLANEYRNGTLLLFRLAPYDYHRYHFPCDGLPSAPKAIFGGLSSVHPIAYSAGRLPLQENERQLIELRSEKCGTVAIVTIGALMVGKISHTYISDSSVNKGDEMGYFSFGGSSLVLLFKKDTIEVDTVFVENSTQGYETSVLMGQPIGLLL